MSHPADVPPGARCTQPGCDRPATDPAEPAGLCPEHHPTHETETEDETETETETETDTGGLPEFSQLLHEAQGRADRERWEPVEQSALRAVLNEHGVGHLLETGALDGADRWRVVDVSDDNEDPRRRWYYASGDEPRPDEFRRFHDLLTEAAPDDYEPHYFRCRRASKDPAVQFGSWKDDDGRLSVEEAVEWMKEGGNVGIAGRPDGPLVNVDIDDDEETTPEDVPASLRARSRSRTGWHTWYFDPAGDVPNIPTDEYGEIRTDWQYVVAPGSFVASTREDIPDGATDAGYYTVEDAAPVAGIEYDDLPQVFLDAAEETQTADNRETSLDATASQHRHSGDELPRDHEAEQAQAKDRSAGSAVFEIDADAVLSGTHDETDRFGSVFHDSSTGANMSVSGGKLHCWRHGVAHGGLQALAVLSDKTPHGCKQLGAPHKNSGAGRNRLKGDWRLVWAAWHEAKRRGHIPADDPLPYRPLLGLAVEGGVVDSEDLVERESDDGGTYTAFPRGAYNEAIEHAADLADVPLGRDPVTAPPPAGLEDRRTRLVVSPDPDELGPSGPSETPEIPDESALPGYGDLSPRDAQNRTQAALARAIGRQDDALIEALPTMGKTYAAGRAPTLVEGETPVTVVTQRGRNEQYAELCEHAADAGLSLGTAPGEPDGDVYVLPSFKQDCPTANGDHGEDWAELVEGWYDDGATPREIHVHGGREAGDEDDNLPCQRDECEYARLWDFDPDEFELLIGHPLHLSKPKVAGDRTVIIDEYPGGAFETTLAGPHLRGAITRYLREFDGLPFDSFGALAMGRTDSDRRADALAFLEDRGVEPDGLGAIRFDDKKHALAPLAVYTMLATADSGALGNGFARTELPDGGVGVFEYDHGPDDEPAVHILRRPDALAFGGTNVIGLDGTPTPFLWEVATGCDLTHRVVLEDRRAEYVEHALGYRIVQTSEYSRPYYNPENINTDRDAALLQAIRHRHGEAPGVITTSTAFIGWDRDDLIDLDTDPDPWEAAGGPVGEILKYGNMLGSNRFGTTRVGAVIGSQHYGDGVIGKWAAYAGEAATLGTDARGQDEDGRMTELDYGETGNRVHEHMKRATLQAMFRFGRDGNGATVYVDSDVLPDWVPVHGHAEVATTCDGLRGTIEALEDLDGPATTAEIEDHEAVEIKGCQIRRHIDRLRETGAIVTQPDPEDGRRDVHTLTDTAGITPGGVVTLPDVGGENSGESCGTLPYSTTIGDSTSKSDSPETADEPAPAAAEDSGESCGRSPYSKTIGNPSAKPDGGTPSEEADTPTDEKDDPAALDYPAMAAEPDDGTDWELTRRVIGMPDAEDGGG